MPRRAVARTLRLLVSAGLLLWLATRVSLADAAQAARTMQMPPLVAAAGAIVIGQVLRAVRTCALVRGGVRGADLAPMLRMQMLAFLPGMLSPAKAGELFKVALLRREWGVSVARGTSAFFAERLADVAVLGACAAWGLVVVFGGVIPHAAYGVAAAAGLAAVGGAWVWRANMLPPSLHERMRNAIADVRWVPFAITTVLYWALVVGIVWLFARSAQSAVSYPIMLGAVPLSLLSALLPISFGGFGVRESAMVLLFQHEAVGCTGAQALGIALLYDGLGLGIPALMGLGYVLAGPRHA